MAKNHAPITSFGAELHATLRKGADTKFKITFDTPQLAIRFNQRINQLRNAMKHHKHPDWENLYRCGVYVDKTDPRTLWIGPKDHEFRIALEQAGVEVGEAPRLVEVEIPASSPTGSVDEFLADLTAETSVQKVLSEDTDAESEPRLENL